MPINTRAAGTAGAITAAVLWTLCSAWVAFVPVSSPHAVLGTLFHFGMPPVGGGGAMPASMMAGGAMMTWSVTWGSFGIGLIVWSAIFALVCATYAVVYNRSTP